MALGRFLLVGLLVFCFFSSPALTACSVGQEEVDANGVSICRNCTVGKKIFGTLVSKTNNFKSVRDLGLCSQKLIISMAMEDVENAHLWEPNALGAPGSHQKTITGKFRTLQQTE